MSREYFATLNGWTVEEYIPDSSSSWEYNETYKFKCEVGYDPYDYVFKLMSRWGRSFGSDSGIFRKERAYGSDKFRAFWNYKIIESEDEYQALKCRRLEG
tara:strand:+ start:267 stop:566 length:300 start_codon:yes stop_codon:yes gene_type:complete